MDESVHIATPDHVELEFELAGLGSRFAAYLIDFLVSSLVILGVVVVLLFTGVAGVRSLLNLLRGEGAWAMSWGLAILVLFFFLITWGYFVLFEGLRQGVTPGKRRMGIRVIRQDGLPIGLREAALRNLVRAADMLPPPCYFLGGAVMYFDRHGRRLGDMVAGTLVVVEKFAAQAQDASGAAWASRIEQGRSRQAVTLANGSVSAHQISLIEQFLARRHDLTQERRDALAWQITEPLLTQLGEEREAFVRHPERTARCEQFLLQIVDLAQTKETSPLAKATTAEPRPLF